MMNNFLKLALFSLIGLVLVSFVLGLVQDNQNYYSTPNGGGYGSGKMGPGKHMGDYYHRPGMQGSFDYEFDYNAGYGK